MEGTVRTMHCLWHFGVVWGLGLWEDVKLLLDLAKEFKGFFFDT